MNTSPPRLKVEYAKPGARYSVTAIRTVQREEWRVTCPFCSATLWVDKWSLERQGKKCSCGAWFNPNGTAEARR